MKRPRASEPTARTRSYGFMARASRSAKVKFCLRYKDNTESGGSLTVTGRATPRRLCLPQAAC